MRRLLAPNLLSPRRARLERLRITLAEGARTTLHVASYELAFYRPRVVVLDEPAPLARWCREQGVRNAIVGGFFLRPDCAPLGELRIGGQRVASVPFDAPFGEVRACVNIDAARVRIARRDQLGASPREICSKLARCWSPTGYRSASTDAITRDSPPAPTNSTRTSLAGATRAPRWVSARSG